MSDKVEVRVQLHLEFADEEEMHKAADSIHDQLVGNPDYIDSRIILSKGPLDANPNCADLTIFKDATTHPTITLQF